MKKIILLIQIAFLTGGLFAQQTSGDILENGIKIKKDQALFLEFDPDEHRIKYALSEAIGDPKNPIKPKEIKDSTIFLVNEGVQVYLLPFNPLVFSFSDTTSILIDPLFESHVEGFNTIFNTLDKILASDNILTSDSKANSSSMNSEPESNQNDRPFVFYLKDTVEQTMAALKKDQSKSIAEVFTGLKEMTFLREDTTISQLDRYKNKLNKLKDELNLIDKSLSNINDTLNTFNGKFHSSHDLDFMAQYVFEEIVTKLQQELKYKQNQLKNLDIAYEECKLFQEKASKGGRQPGLNWCLKIPDVKVGKKEINQLKISIFSQEIILSDDNEIISKRREELTNKTIYFRNYNLFVPEVSAGIAFTSFSYNSYSTTSDSTGRSFVANPTRNFRDNLNISTMMNFNFFIPNSYVHPLIQIGAGINNGIPTILTGGGFRFNIGNKRKLAISSGLAWTWMQELGDLSVGDEISGQSDIDNDLQYKFSWPPKGYLGIQINL